jgi:formyltetrahydrofolate synthetase
VPRETGFDIAAASEVMAILCLAADARDLKQRLARIVVGFRPDGSVVTAADLKAVGAMAALLRDAVKPNLVQTREGVPALVHGGPFANIAHGTNSIQATRLALAYAEVVVTEAGFAFELGAEKFFDINCRYGNFAPVCTVLVATLRALKMHGGVPLLKVAEPDPGAVERGLENLEKHVENIRKFEQRCVVAINHFPTDTAEEIAVVRERCDGRWRSGAGRTSSRSTSGISRSRRRSTPSRTRCTAPRRSTTNCARAATARCSRSSATTGSRCASPRPSSRSPTTPRCSAAPRTSWSPCARCKSRPGPGS